MVCDYLSYGKYKIRPPNPTNTATKIAMIAKEASMIISLVDGGSTVVYSESVELAGAQYRGY